MSDAEWQQYMADLPPELRDLAGHIMERINTVINRERNRAVGEHQDIHQRLDVKKVKIADIRMIINDLVARVAALEQGGDTQ